MLRQGRKISINRHRLFWLQEKAFKEAEANIEAAQKNQKETYDRKHQLQVFPEGTEVLLENTYQKQRKGGKMQPLWLGPYTMHRNLRKGLYELKNKKGKLVKTSIASRSTQEGRTVQQ